MSAAGSIIGTRGDGAIALRRAFIGILQRGDVGYSEKPNGATAIVDGEIKVSPYFSKHRKIRLVWTIRNSAQKEIAGFEQKNKIIIDRMSRLWRLLTFDNLLAMRGQILEAMRRLETSVNKALRVPPNLR